MRKRRHDRQLHYVSLMSSMEKQASDRLIHLKRQRKPDVVRVPERNMKSDLKPTALSHGSDTMQNKQSLGSRIVPHYSSSVRATRCAEKPTPLTKRKPYDTAFGDMGYSRRHVKSIRWRPPSARSRQPQIQPQPPSRKCVRSRARPASAHGRITHRRANGFIGRRYGPSPSAAMRRSKGNKARLNLQRDAKKRVEYYLKQRRLAVVAAEKERVVRERRFSIESASSLGSNDDSEGVELPEVVDEDRSQVVQGLGSKFHVDGNSSIEEEPSIDLEDYFYSNRKELRENRVGFLGSIRDPSCRKGASRAKEQREKLETLDSAAAAQKRILAGLDFKSLCLGKRSTFATVERFVVQVPQTGTLGPGSYDYDLRKVT